MRILITGAAGFLGSHLCDRMLAEGHEVIGMDNFVTGNRENLVHLVRNKYFTFKRQDVSNPITIPQKLDAILHFASPASPNPASPFGYPNLPVETLKAGSLGTFNTLDLALENQARYLFASTSEIYGDPLEHPQTETYWGHVNPVGPRSMYDEAKRFSEALIMAYFRSKSADTRIVRIFNTYGPRMRLDDGRVVPSFIQQALLNKPVTIFGDGMQTRSFCYVDDLVDGIYRLLLSDEHLPVNIGNPEETTILEFAETINRLTGNPAGVEFSPNDRMDSDPQRRRPDISRARNFLNWEPQVDFETGLKKTIASFKEKLGMK
jgi:dTDP-glucose 4,6-dehydratase